MSNISCRQLCYTLLHFSKLLLECLHTGSSQILTAKMATIVGFHL